MSKRDSIYKELANFDDDYLSDDPDFITRLFGARLVGALDSTLEDKFNLIEGEGEEKLQEMVKILSSLSDEQKLAVKQLLKLMGKDFFYWMLVKIRNFPYHVDISFLNSASEKICSIDEEELHHQYFDWIEEFSDHVEGN